MSISAVMRRVVLVLALLCAAIHPFEAGAQSSMSDYTSFPTFVSDTVAPNILILYDTSTSMEDAAHGGETFSNATAQPGLFDATECYRYDTAAAKFQPDSATANGSSPPSSCPSGYPWSGNLLNFATSRRIDIAKWALIGGKCQAGGRDSQGKCTTTLVAESASVRNTRTQVDKAALSGLMPQAILNDTNLGSTVYFLLPGATNLEGSFCVDNDTGYPSGSTCGDADGFLEEREAPEYVLAVDITTPASGIMQDVGLGKKARIGFMTFTSIDADGAELVADIGSSVTTLVDAVDATTNPGGVGTPLAEALYEATRYLAQISPHYNAGHFPYTVQSRDPYYFVAPDWAAASTYVHCCKSYVIMLTDGEASSDTNIPASIQGLADGIGGTGGAEYLDDVSYWARTTDIRDGTIATINEAGKDLTGEQNVSVYTFFAFGSGSTLLQTAAKFGGFQDINGNNQPDLDDEWDQVNNLTGAATPDGVPDNYFESTSAADIKDRMLATISSILQRSGSGSAASVLASSSTGEGAVYQSYFYPSTVEGLKDIKWTGHTHGLFIDAFGNLREDTNGDGRLVYEEDQIVRTKFDTATSQVMLERYDDADGDGIADTASPVGAAVELRRAKGIWEAGTRLANMTSGSRTILTWIDKDNDGVVDGGEQIDVSTANSADLAPYLRPGPAPFTTDNIINYVRGDEIAGLRTRQLTVGGSKKVWKLGDAIHARPIVVGAPAQRYDLIYGDTSYGAFLNTYKDRRQVAYVGANDGMLHAFNAGFFHPGDDPATTTKTEHGYFTTTAPGVTNTPALGTELFGFIPQELLPHLIWLTRPDYAHVYYVDLTPKVTDARIFTPDADHPNGWGTILMGGFRLGGSCGSCPAGNGVPMTVNDDFNYDGDTVDAGDTRTFYSAYFVLDITNPEAAGYPKLLWSFSTSGLGFTTTTPSMLRVSPSSSSLTDNTNAGWYMVMGSGPTGYDGRTTQSGKLYAMDLKTGAVTTMTADTADSFLADSVTVDRDFDYRVDAAYMGGVFFDGSLPWRGKLYRLAMHACGAAPCTTATWGIADGVNRQPTELLDTFPSSGANELGPVTAGVAVAVDDSNKLWVFAGTGRYFDSIDKSSTAQQYFVGVKDKVMGGCTESTRTNCQSNDLLDVSSADVCLLGTGTCGGTTDQVTGVSGASDFPSLISLVASKDGWFTTLPGTGERALSRPLAFGGLVIFPTFVPTSGTCESQGDSYLYALYYLTGSAYSSPVIGTSGSGTKSVNRSTSLGSGLASQAIVHIGDGGGGGKGKAFVQKSTAEMVDLDTQSAGAAITSRFVTWYHARD